MEFSTIWSQHFPQTQQFKSLRMVRLHQKHIQIESFWIHSDMQCVISILTSVLSFKSQRTSGYIREAGRENTKLKMLWTPTCQTCIKEQTEWKPPFESHGGFLYAHRKVYFCFHELTEDVVGKEVDKVVGVPTGSSVHVSLNERHCNHSDKRFRH